MTAAELLAECHARRIALQAHGGQLDIDAPAGELTPSCCRNCGPTRPNWWRCCSPRTRLCKPSMKLQPSVRQ